MTRDATKILERMVGDDSELLLQIALSDIAAGISEQLYEARTERNLTQNELAEMVGTSQSAVARVENADYDGHSIRTLARIACALKLRLQVNFIEEDESPIRFKFSSGQSESSDATGSTCTFKVGNGATNERITKTESSEYRNPIGIIRPSPSSDSGLASTN
ncbi:MAG: helix-turn-helix transcriptional regulator [Phycisphaerales bacterium]